MKLLTIISLFVLSNLLWASEIKAQDWPSWFKVGTVASDLDGEDQPFYYYKSTSEDPKPLIVSLHQWSSGYDHYSGSVASQAMEKEWNFIHPDFRGANNHPKACCSQFVLSDIAQSIDWAIENMNVDTTAIYIVGASGGGYATLCSFMKLKKPVAAYMAFVPISDLEAKYYEALTRKEKYANDILKCTDSDGSTLDTEKARNRSPIFWETPTYKLKNSKLYIYTGIHDGYEGTVPITQSINFYNKLLRDVNAPKESFVPKDDIIYMLTKRSFPLEGDLKKIGDRKIYYQKRYGNIELSIFDGGHEILEDAVLERLTQ